MNFSDFKNVGMSCPGCKRIITKEVVENAVFLKKQNAINSSMKALNNGTRMGPKGKINWDEVRKLREMHWTKTDIAKKLNVSRCQISKGSIRLGIK